MAEAGIPTNGIAACSAGCEIAPAHGPDVYSKSKAGRPPGGASNAIRTLEVVGNMGDWLSQFPILSSTTQTPPKTLVRRVLLFSGTMRVVLSYPKKVAF
eukprot:COSAG03_NODE_10051_length_675_cov_14.229167_1_plen_98_part_10